MTVAAIRTKLMTYLADADDSKVKALYTLLENDMESGSSYTLTPEQLAIVEERHTDYMNGKSELTDWESIKKSARSKRKAS